MTATNTRDLQRRVEALATKAAARSTDPTRHKCFVSYHHEDQDEVETFIDDFGSVFIARALGVSDEDDFVDSDDTDYVMSQIREKYLTDSTVTIVLIGKCTWSRRYVDWEIMSTLRNESKNKRSGLLGITLPSAAGYDGKKPPDRLNDNLDGSSGYAAWKKYPTNADKLRGWIDTAFDAPTDKGDLVDNTRARLMEDQGCP